MLWPSATHRKYGRRSKNERERVMKVVNEGELVLVFQLAEKALKPTEDVYNETTEDK